MQNGFTSLRSDPDGVGSTPEIAYRTRDAAPSKPGVLRYETLFPADRLRTRAGSEGWDVDADDFLAEFERAFETEIAAHVEAISTGEDF